MRVLSRVDRSPIALTATGLAKLYGGTLALVGVDLSARSGELVLVRGANGSGKSTLLRLLAGLATPSAGQVRLTCEAGTRPRVAFVGHAGHLFADLTPEENLTLAARLAGADQTSALSILDRLGVAAAARTRSRWLSSGTLRRVALARGLATDPDILLVDEPFAGLDAEAARLVGGALEEVRNDGRLVIVASHEDARSRASADRSVELVAGRIADHTAAESVLAR
ncbi:MAG: heme exporter protein [Chloroflexota bacterium]|nr:heme exporter protein [Chloroflexota bacterium]